MSSSTSTQPIMTKIMIGTTPLVMAAMGSCSGLASSGLCGVGGGVGGCGVGSGI